MAEGSLTFLQTIIASGLGFTATKVAEAWLSHQFAEARLHDEQITADIIELERIIHDLRDRGLLYWSHAADEERRHSEEAAVIGRLFFAGRLVESIFAGSESKKQMVDVRLNKLDDALTGGDFQVSNRKAEPARLVKIERHCYELVHFVRQERRSTRRRFLRLPRLRSSS